MRAGHSEGRRLLAGAAAPLRAPSRHPVAGARWQAKPAATGGSRTLLVCEAVWGKSRLLAWLGITNEPRLGTAAGCGSLPAPRPAVPVPPGFERAAALKKNGASACTQVNRKFRRRRMAENGIDACEGDLGRPNPSAGRAMAFSSCGHGTSACYGHHKLQAIANKKGNRRMVRKEGFEPSCPQGAADFESAASAVPPLPQA